MKRVNNSSLSVKPKEKRESIIETSTFEKIQKIDAQNYKIDFSHRVSIFVRELTNGVVQFQINQDKKIIIDKIKHQLSFNDGELINQQTIKFKINEIRIQENSIIIQNQKNQIIIEKIYTQNQKLTVDIQSHEQDKFYGFGGKTGMNLDKKYSHTSNWATDLCKAHNDQDLEIYTAINFNLINKKMNSNIGIFVDNPTRTKYDMRQEKHFFIQVEINDLDLYLILENSVKDVLFKYSQITGKPFLPNKWSLGHHLSKHSYENTQVVENLIQMAKINDIPIDAIYLDILYMSEMRSFTIDENRFSDFEKLVQDSRKKGVEIVPILNPGVREKDFSLFQQGQNENAFILDSEGQNPLLDEVWPGICAFPDFFNSRGTNFWKKCLKFYTAQGIRGFWLDMNEPATFNPTHTLDLNSIHECAGVKVTHHEVHNNYGTYLVKSTWEALNETNFRPHLVSRSGSAGIQKYSAIWTGDNFSYWFQLEQSLPMVLNLGLSGIPFAGPDIGGFEYDASAELLTRWYQANILFGFFRNHCSINRRAQEPWTFNDQTTKAISQAIKFRYRYLPTLYTQASLTHQTNQPFITPLWYQFEFDPQAYQIDNQYLMNKLMVAPILKKNTFSRLVYLPDNQNGWIDYETKQYFEGNQNIIKKIDYHQLGIFVENKSMIFATSPTDHKSGYFEKIIVEIYDFKNEQKIQTIFYDDDGISWDFLSKNDYQKIKFTYQDGIIYFKGLNQDFTETEIQNKFQFLLMKEQIEIKTIKKEN